MLTSYLSTYHPIIAPSPENDRKYVPTHLPSPITSYHCTISRETKPERSEKERSTKNYGRSNKKGGKVGAKKEPFDDFVFRRLSPFLHLSIHTTLREGPRRWDSWRWAALLSCSLGRFFCRLYTCIPYIIQERGLRRRV